MALIGVTTAVITANIEKRSVMSQKIKDEKGPFVKSQQSEQIGEEI